MLFMAVQITDLGQSFSEKMYVSPLSPRILVLHDLTDILVNLNWEGWSKIEEIHHLSESAFAFGTPSLVNKNVFTLLNHELRAVC